MKHLKIFVVATLLLSLLIGSAFSVFASGTEATDQSQENMDWETVDWYHIDAREFLRNLTWDQMIQLRDWLKSNTDLSLALFIASQSEDRYEAIFTNIIFQRFKEDPYPFIQAIAQSDEVTQKSMVRTLCFGGWYVTENVPFLEGIQLPDTATDAETAVLAEIIRYYKEMYGPLMTDSEVDWNLIDWENFNIPGLFDYLWEEFDDKFYSLCKWLEGDVEHALVFRFYYFSDGFYAEGLSTSIFPHFERDPYGVIQAIAMEEEEFQGHLTSAVCFGAMDLEDLYAALDNFQLPDTATDAEKAVWQAILNWATERYFYVPETGDPILLPVFLLTFSGAGMAILVGKKKKMGA